MRWRQGKFEKDRIPGGPLTPHLFSLASLCLVFCCVYFFTLCIIGGSKAHAEQNYQKPQRVVSINVCADQFLYALAHKTQILALSPYVHNPHYSFYANEVQAIPHVRDDVESVLTLKPDLVIASSFNKPNTLRLLKAQNIPVYILPYLADFKAISAEFIKLSAKLGNPQKGHALRRRLENALERARTLRLLHKQDARRRNKIPTVLHYQRAGYVDGTKSLMDKVIDLYALDNLAARVAGKGYKNVPLERIIKLQPDYLILAPQSGYKADLGHAKLRHPALQRLLEKAQRLSLPTREIVCPGPSIIAAINRLSQNLSLHSHKEDGRKRAH